MVRIFNASRIMFLLLVIIGALCLMLFSVRLEISGMRILPLFGFTPVNNIEWIFSVLLFLIWIIISYYIAAQLATMRARDIRSLLIDKCDSRSYITLYEKVLHKYKKGKYKNTVTLNLLTGYLHGGEFEKAKQTLHSIDYLNMNVADQIMFDSVLMTLYILMKDADNANITFKELKTKIQHLNLPTRKMLEFISMFENIQLKCNIPFGNKDRIEEYFIDKFNNEKHLLLKLIAMYNLAEFYIQNNQLKKAVSSLEYVSNYGNTTYYAYNAKKILDEIKNSQEAIAIK